MNEILNKTPHLLKQYLFLVGIYKHIMVIYKINKNSFHYKKVPNIDYFRTNKSTIYLSTEPHNIIPYDVLILSNKTFTANNTFLT